MEYKINSHKLRAKLLLVKCINYAQIMHITCVTHCLIKYSKTIQNISYSLKHTVVHSIALLNRELIGYQ